MSTTIKLRCIDRVLTFESTPVVASGGLEVDFLEVDFCPKWDGLARTAVFWRREDDAYHVPLDSADRGAIPPELLTTDGVLYFGLFGVSPDGRQRTSEVLRYTITKGAITTGTKPSDPTPELYTQLLAQYADLLNRHTDLAAAVARDLQQLEQAQEAKKADKVTGATAGNFAGLDAAGNLTDSGKNTKSYIYVYSGDTEPAEGPVLWLHGNTMKYKDATGKLQTFYPATKAENVEGLSTGVPEHEHSAADVTAGTLAGKVQANPEAMAVVGEAQLRDVVLVTTDPGAGAASSYPDGTVILVYE